MNTKLLEIDTPAKPLSAYDINLGETVTRILTGYEIWHAHRKEDADWRKANNIPESTVSRPYHGALEQAQLPDGSWIVIMPRSREPLADEIESCR